MKLFLFLKKDILEIIVIIAAVVYITTALNSHGFYHADEHYQIIEFAGLKLGTHSPNELAWEYGAQIRPALQPTICFILLKALNSLKLNDPYFQAFFLRLISSLLAIGVITYLILKTRNFIEGKTNKLIYYLLSFFLWFIPVISVRFSSETWSGLLFISAFAVFHGNFNDSHKPYIIGLLSGVSFLFRFQIALAILGFGIWLIFVNHSTFKYLLKISVAFVVMVFLGFLIDTWFYGEPVFTPWNYFYINIVKGAASGFGTSPWYFYIIRILSYTTYFIGIPILLSFIILLISKPKNLLLWIILPFIIGHSIISHKEERFLFPIVFLLPLILTESYIVIKKVIANRRYLRILNYSLLLVFVPINSIGLFAMAQKSTGIGRMEITRYIHKNYGNQSINLIACPWANPYNPWGLPIKFYLEEDIQYHEIKNLCELNDSLFLKNTVNLLVIRKIDKYDKDCVTALKTFDLKFELQSNPGWIESINDKYKGFDNYNILELYRYTKSE